MITKNHLMTVLVFVISFFSSLLLCLEHLQDFCYPLPWGIGLSIVCLVAGREKNSVFLNIDQSEIISSDLELLQQQITFTCEQLVSETRVPGNPIIWPEKCWSLIIVMHCTLKREDHLWIQIMKCGNRLFINLIC